jgi:hypothetical protein
MTEPTADKSTAERVLDLALYAPLGLAFSVAEAVPDLARKGRSRFGLQVALARTVGQLAVRQGYRQLVRVVTTPGAIPFDPFVSPRPAGPGHNAPPSRTSAAPARGEAAAHGAAATSPAPDRAEAPDATEASGVAGAVFAPLSPSRSNGSRHRSARAPQGGAAPELAIHSYDSLSATQVVQRLAGLSREEVAAVRAYEAATRRRRTILARAEQLLG